MRQNQNLDRGLGDTGRLLERYLSRREALALIGGTLAVLHSSCSPGSDPVPTSSIPALDGPLHHASLTDVARLVELREISPVELTQAMLERIEAVDGRLHSYITVMRDAALTTAHRAEKEIAAGRYRGPLHGIPVAVKDLCFTRGVRTTGGLRPMGDFVPEYDATVVSKLEAAGAVLLGKLNMAEGAMAGYHPDFEVPINPWGDELWPGASSSGPGVATSVGLCFAALGTDTGGSIRFPSMCNGIVGLKPTYGRVSRYGVLVLADSLDHVGPMTRRTADAAAVLEAIAGFDPNDPTSLEEPVPDMFAALGKGIEGLRIGFDRGYATNGVDPELVASMETALGELERLGAEIVGVEMPILPEGLGETWFTICLYEACVAHAANFPSRADEYGAYFRDFLEAGSAVTGEQYAEASRLRREFSNRFHAVLSTVNALVSPAGGVTFPIDPEIQRGGIAAFEPIMPHIQLQFTIPADFAGTPTLTLPCGVSKGGLPHAFQFMGSRLSESMLCRIGHAFEQATSWHTRHPPV
jgi:amidase